MKWTANNIRESGAKAISESLKTNTTLTKLNLGCDDKREKNRKRNKNKEWNRNEMIINKTMKWK